MAGAREDRRASSDRRHALSCRIGKVGMHVVSLMSYPLYPLRIEAWIVSMTGGCRLIRLSDAVNGCSRASRQMSKRKSPDVFISYSSEDNAHV